MGGHGAIIIGMTLTQLSLTAAFRWLGGMLVTLRQLRGPQFAFSWSMVFFTKASNTPSSCYVSSSSQGRG